jgi:hypothetical protein
VAQIARHTVVGGSGEMPGIRIRSPQEFWSGIVFGFFGACGLWFGRGYEVGSPAHMGPGFLPTMLSIILLGFAAILFWRAISIEGPRIERPGFRSNFFVLVAIVAFGLTIERLGLVVATLLCVALASLASRDMRWLEAVALSLGMAIFAVVVFIYGLGQPLDIWPRW